MFSVHWFHSLKNTKILELLCLIDQKTSLGVQCSSGFDTIPWPLGHSFIGYMTSLKQLVLLIFASSQNHSLIPKAIFVLVRDHAHRWWLEGIKTTAGIIKSLPPWQGNHSPWWDLVRAISCRSFNVHIQHPFLIGSVLHEQGDKHWPYM